MSLKTNASFSLFSSFLIQFAFFLSYDYNDSNFFTAASHSFFNMPFKYSYICELLSSLERLKTRDVALLPRDFFQESKEIIRKWFHQHRRVIDALDTDGVALLSTLFPERRSDRVYGLQEKRLSSLVARALCFNSTRVKNLNAYTTPGNGDLGACLERVLQAFDCEPKPGTSVTIEEADRTLQQLASRCDFSSPAVRAIVCEGNSEDLLRRLFLRMSSSEAKWMIRLILKNFSPVVLDESLVFHYYHFLLPGLLRFQNDFGVAVNLLRTDLKRYHANPDPKSAQLFKQEAARTLTPRIGIKVSRPPFWKARSIKHCINMALTRGAQWSIERKYDGEYCEIHIDLSKGDDFIQIFSKSGKDSTQDRRKAHKIIAESLRIGSPRCFFEKRCIVLAELVAYSDRDGTQPFEKIRKHVDRSGRRIGAELDSPVQDYEHLMLVYFDVLMIDDDFLLRNVYEERRNALRQLIRKREGYAMTSERQAIDMSDAKVAEILRYQFAAAIANRAEGLVLKPLSLPYASLAGEYDEDDAKHGMFIKLKVDYMQELGSARDVADFAVVGASYDAKLAQQSGLKGIAFTGFHLGCLINSEAVRFGATPVYRMVGVITADQCIPKPELQALNDWVRFRNAPFVRKGTRLQNPQQLDLLLDTTDASKMTCIISEPCVVEVLGSGFVKASSTNFYMLRHPRILKLHLDRDWREAVTFDALQDQARVARNAPAEGETQEALKITEALIGKHLKRAEESMTSGRATTATKSTVSPGSALRVRTAINVQSPCPSRRSPTKKVPVLVRVDTAELNTPATVGVKAVPARVLQTKTGGSNPMPTPPTTSPIEAISSGHAQQAVSAPVAKSLPTGKRFLELAGDDRQTSAPKAKQARLTDKVQPLNRPTSISTTNKPSVLSTPAASYIALCGLTGLASAPRMQSTTTPADLPSHPASPSQNALQSMATLSRTFSAQVDLSQTDAPKTLHPKEPGHCDVQAADEPATCVFTKAVIMVTPCAQIPWLVKELLPWHGATMIDDFQYLSRDTAAYDPMLDAIVPESQAYLGKKRIILVDRKRPQQIDRYFEITKFYGIKDKLFWMDYRFCDKWHELEASRKKLALGQGQGYLQPFVDILFKHFLGLSMWTDEKRDWVVRKDIMTDTTLHAALTM